jgi:hypothetical protein
MPVSRRLAFENERKQEVLGHERFFAAASGEFSSSAVEFVGRRNSGH